MDVIDAPPAPRAYPTLVPFTVTLPDELLRHVFEIAATNSKYDAKNIMLVARWVRLWMLHTFFASQRILSKKDLQKLLNRPDSLLAHVRSLRVSFFQQNLMRQLLQRTSGLERLALCHEALVQTRKLHSGDNRIAYPDALSKTLREIETTNVGQFGWPSQACGLDHVAFANVTHARLGIPCVPIIHQLADKTLVVLPSLTHLAFDVSLYDEHHRAELEPIVAALRVLVSSPARDNLQVLALELAPVPAQHVRTNPIYLRHGIVHLRYHWTGDGIWYDWRRYWLELGLHRTKVVQIPRKQVVSRPADWAARGMGRAGFWERVEKYGQVALPRPTEEGYYSRD